MEKPATPLPWKLDSNQDVEGVAITIGNQGETWNFAAASQDAAYIVTACNAYPHLTAINAELVEALRRLEYWFNTDEEILDAMDHNTRADHERQLGIIRNAIARAMLTARQESSNGH